MISVVFAILMTAPADAPDHWAFRPPTRPALPEVRDPGRVRNPIDAFILATLDAEGLVPASEADRLTLLRRLSFDLIGLPPSPEEADAFLADRAPAAYERLVDRLLASPHYGERQAQGWLDLARYADSDGFEFDQARPEIWRYRDWVVSAFNRDLPYNRFVRLQIAGDEAEPGHSDALVATGFNRLYPDMVDLNDQGLRRQNALNDITETTASVFLGLTMGCARCHDHKYDPIKQSDFYSLQAFFTPARFRDDLELAGNGADPSPRARGLDETGEPVPPTYLLRRGEYGNRGPEVLPSFPASLTDETEPTITPTAGSSGRRSALADWLVDPANPMTSRVLVNRLWQGHFGRGIVASSSDFGLIGDDPSHPELLDWLATEFLARGQSLKAMHRLIVTSATYRQSSRFDAHAFEADPENTMLWRHSRRRMGGEAIRDAMLAASGMLNHAIGGPCVFPELPAELTKLSGKGAAWPVSPREEDRDRRSLYVFLRRNLRFPLFEAFDKPDTNASCPRRAVTTIAPQALSLFNGKLSADCAAALADRGRREADTRPAQVERLYRLALGRPPDPEEQRIASEFLEGASLADLALAIFNVNEFVYID